MEIISKRDIVVEVCPISNQLTSAVRNGNYSFKKFIEYDVPFVLCSDNPAIHKRSIDDDYNLFLEKTGRADILSKMFSIQKKYSFIR
jgi:adenosine deaminase